MLRCAFVASALVAAIVYAGSAQAQSFNCRYAKTPSENLICDNPELGRLDEVMAAAFYALSPAMRRREGARQNRFLAARERCGYNFGCVAAVYRQRIDSLYRVSSDF